MIRLEGRFGRMTVVELGRMAAVAPATARDVRPAGDVA
jgi:hypothetical protein